MMSIIRATDRMPTAEGWRVAEQMDMMMEQNVTPSGSIAIRYRATISIRVRTGNWGTKMETSASTSTRTAKGAGSGDFLCR